MSNAVMPLTDYVAACDAVREKTGSADTIKSGEMAVKINDVFKAGQLDIISNAEALKGSASGTDIITIADTSPVEHNVKCSVSSDTVTDLSSVTVKRLGKNLCNTGTATFTRSITIELPTPIPANTPFVFSGIFETDYTGTGNLIQFYYIDGTTESSNWRMFSVGVTDRQKVTGNFSKAIKSITVYAGPNWSSSAGLTATLTDVQFEIGAAATEFEPYIEPTEHTANAEGIVEGVKSLYPNMTLISNVQGVIITAQYIKDIDKAFEERLAALEAAIVNNE